MLLAAAKILMKTVLSLAYYAIGLTPCSWHLTTVFVTLPSHLSLFHYDKSSTHTTRGGKDLCDN